MIIFIFRCMKHTIYNNTDIYMNWFQNILFNYGKMNNGFGFFELVSNSESRWPKQNARLCTFFRHACNFRKFCFFQKITNDGSIIHVRFYISLPLIYSNTGEMVLPFLEGIKYMYLVHNHFHLNIPHLPIQYYLSSVSIRCRQSHTNVV